MANKTAIDIAIRDTKLRMENAQFKIQIMLNTVETLRDQMNMLELVREDFLKSEQRKKEWEQKNATEQERARGMMEYVAGEGSGDCEPKF